MTVFSDMEIVENEGPILETQTQSWDGANEYFSFKIFFLLKDSSPHATLNGYGDSHHTIAPC